MAFGSRRGTGASGRFVVGIYLERSMYACICRAIKEDEVRRAGRAGVTEEEDIIVLFGLRDPSCCGRCIRRVDRFVDLATEGGNCAPTSEDATIPSTAVIAPIGRSTRRLPAMTTGVLHEGS